MYFSLITPRPGFERRAAREWIGSAYGEHQWLWRFLPAPAGTPRAIIDKINREVKSILSLQELKAAMLQQGAEVVYTTPEEFDKFQRAEIIKWSKVIRDAKIPPQ